MFTQLNFFLISSLPLAILKLFFLCSSGRKNTNVLTMTKPQNQKGTWENMVKTLAVWKKVIAYVM